MDTLILGLLILQSRTIYEIRKILSTSMRLLYSCSTGSIQAALRKLSTNNYVKIVEIVENGRGKKVYSITEEGKEYFDNWVNSDFSLDANKNSEMTKFYFMGLSNKETRKERLDKHIENLKKAYDALSVVYEEGKKKLSTIENNDVFLYQLYTVKYGMDSALFQLKWFEESMNEILNNE